jgi:hypothetical protein
MDDQTRYLAPDHMSTVHNMADSAGCRWEFVTFTRMCNLLARYRCNTWYITEPETPKDSTCGRCDACAFFFVPARFEELSKLFRNLLRLFIWKLVIG